MAFVPRPFNIGEKVTWESQAQGSWKPKTGEVVEIVPPRKNPKTPLKNPGMARNEVSYVVSVPSASGRGASKFYWPRTVVLRPVDLV